MTLVMSPVGDFDANDVLNADDVDWLSAKVRGNEGFLVPAWCPDAMFDVNGDRVVNLEDHRIWVKDLAKTWYGDANLDGEFNAGDFVQVFDPGKYETRQDAGWSEGDWNSDGVFDTGDFVIAFEDGGYEQGPRTDAVAVPEPGAWALSLLASGLCLWRKWR